MKIKGVYRNIMQSLTIIMIVLFSYSSCTKISSNNIFKRHDKKYIKFFMEVGFDDFKHINKWQENIKYDYVGQPHEGDIEILDTIFSEVMQIIKPIRIDKIKKGEKPDLVIYFGDKMESIIPCSQGLSNVRRNNRFLKIGDAAIWADPKFCGRRRQAIFRHELLHVLGLSHPPKGKLYKVIISPYFFIDERGWDDPNFVLIYKYTELDIAVLSILYDKDIPNGLSLESFKKSYNNYQNDSTKR